MKAKDGVTFNPVFTRNNKGDVSGTVSVEGNYDPCSWCAMKLKYQIATAGNLKTTVTVDKLAEGVWCPSWHDANANRAHVLERHKEGNPSYHA